MSEEGISAIRLRNTLLVPVPSDPDDELVAALQSKVLGLMEKYQASGVILDISTVDVLDSFFARTLIETAQMINLMGGKTALVGMRPNVAITATQLGLRFDNIKTCMDVDTALSSIETIK